MQDDRGKRRSVSRFVIHLVCITKYRCKIFDAAPIGWLAGHARQVFANSPATQRLITCHPPYPPKLSVSVPVNAALQEPARHHLSRRRALRCVGGALRWRSSKQCIEHHRPARFFRDL
jgi:hypothetical protein